MLITEETICINCVESKRNCTIRKAFTDIHKTYPDIIYIFGLLKCPNHKTIDDEANEQGLSCGIPDGKEHECPACGCLTKERLCPDCGTCVTCKG